MGFKSCIFDLNKSSTVTAVLDVIGSLLIGGVITFTWLTVNQPIQYYYSPVKIGGTNDTSSRELWGLERREGLEGCVITWCGTILLVLCGWRIISAAILALATQQKSLHLLQYWIGYKCFVLMISTFTLMTAFTSKPIIPCATISFVLDIITIWFVRILVPEIALISRGSKR